MLILSWMSAHLAYGLSLVLLLLPPGRLGARFYHLNLGIASALLGVTLLLNPPSPTGVSGIFALGGILEPAEAVWICFFLCAAAAILAGPGVGRLWFQVLLVLAGVGAVLAMLTGSLSLSREAGPASTGQLTFVLGLFSSALLLGSVLVAMNLGHWYLVIANLPFRYLRNYSLIFGSAVVLKLAAMLITLYSFGRRFPDGMSSLTSDFVTGDALFFWLRCVVGIIIPLILAVMVWKTVRIKSNQSATGLLYVAVIFILFGELIAKYILAVRLLPL